MSHFTMPCTRKLVVALSLSLGLLAACSPSEPEPETTQAPPAPAAQTAAEPASTALVLEGATLIVGDGSEPLNNATLIIDGGSIVAAGAANAVDVPEGATRMDLAGATIMPAIIDTHVHLSRERDALVEDLRARARFGVAAAMSLGQDTGDAPFQLREEVIPGAALYRTAGRGLTGPEPGRSDIPHWVTTPEEARSAVQEEAALGVDIIKLWVDDRNGQYEKLSPEIYGAAIDEAHMLGLRVTAHLFSLDDAKGLLRAGVDAFAHGVRDTDIDDEFIMLVKEQPDFVLVPNLPGRGVATDLDWLRGNISDEQLQQLQSAATDQPEAQQAFAIQARNLERLHQEGITVALGTDGNTPWAAHIEMEDMVAAGMSPAEVIVAATRNGARFMRLDNTGTVQPGNSADFIVLDANPLDDITNTRRIRDVYIRGERVERDQ